jgi:hypothetical protein
VKVVSDVVTPFIAFLALGVSVFVLVRQLRGDRKADVSVWFEEHERGRAGNVTVIVVTNHGPAHARDATVTFTGKGGEVWKPSYDASSPIALPLFPIDHLASGESVARRYHAVLSAPPTVQAHIEWRDGRRGLQRKITWTGYRYSA